MIYSYLTPQYYNNAVLFLKSFLKFNGEDEIIYFKTIRVSSKQIENLRAIYSNLYVDSDEATFDIPFSDDDEAGCFSGAKNTVWMNYVADDHRIREFKNAVNHFQDQEYYVFSDIDLLFRGNVINYVYRCKKITVRRRQVRHNYGKFAIGFIVFPKDTIGFVDKWITEIQKTPLQKRQQAHGQLSFYKVIQDYGNLPPQFLDKSFSKHSIIWTPNRGDRFKNYERFLAEYEKE